MVREKLGEDLDDQWREEIFPESVFEAESDSQPVEYITLLETLDCHGSLQTGPPAATAARSPKFVA
jgi:hypothetical protein